MIEAYKAVINALDEATLLATGQGVLLAANPAAALLGVERDTWVKQNLQHFLHSSAESFREFLAMCARSKQPVVGAFSLVTATGIVELKSKGAAVRPKQGDSDAILLIHLYPKHSANTQFTALAERIDQLNQQIIKRQRVEYDLREQKEWLQVTLTSIGDAVIITDKHGSVTFMNPIAEKITGWDAKSAVGRALTDVFIVVNESTREPVQNPVEMVLLEQKVVNLAANSVLLSRGGTEFPIADTAAPIYHNNKLEGVVLVFHDVTLKRNLERQLIERAEKSEEESRHKTMFLAMLAHELRNPIGPISNAIQILKLDSGSQLALNILERQTVHMAQLVNGLIDMARITVGKLSISKQRVDLVNLVEEQCVDLRSTFVRKNIQLDISKSAPSLLVLADPTRLTQVVGNLLSNAEKFTPQDGRVRVSLATRHNDVTLSISDSGPGIDENLLPNLFRPFVQGSQSLARTEGGLGLGLAMVKGIIDLHEGQVTVENQAGGGATFTVTLPEAPLDGIPAAAAPTDKKVLVIEDNHDQAHSLCLLLEKLGGRVYLAFDGKQGVQMATELIPDIVICDIGLPLLDGFQVARKLKSNQATSSSLLIALTGYGQADFVEKAKSAGFEHHYLKPMNLDELKSIMAMQTVSAE